MNCIFSAQKAMIFLPGIQARKLLNLPQQDRVDLRSTCFCHRKIIDIGYVCSVCLSIFCSPIPVCFTCKTKFPISSLKRFVQQINKPNNNGKRKLK
ncbi:transcription factor Tfb4-domain-containing protein [Phakopsora pachyrhizi]|nr:transcription factor Tfb4-domain-containing protein [Phakopsora pachyrhizi]